MPKKKKECGPDGCVHAEECEKRVNQILTALTKSLTKRFEQAKAKGPIERIAEMRAQVVVLSAMAVHTKGFIEEADVANVDDMAASVLSHIEQQAEARSLPN